MTKQTTAMGIMLEYMKGMLEIEDGLILQYGKDEKAVEGIKANWQQLNMIKEMALKLLEKERQQILNAYMAGEGDAYNEKDKWAVDYFNETYK